MSQNLLTRVLVFAPDTLIRGRDGRMLVHTASSPVPAFQTDQPALLSWLCRFFQPTSVAASLQPLAPADRQAVLPALEYLVHCGALIDQAATSSTTAAEDELAHARARQHVQTLARSVYELAADVLAFGPWGERVLRERTQAGVERRLMGLLANVDGLRASFSAMRAPYLEEQAKRLDVDLGRGHLKLHIGCGDILLDGWVNIDIHPAPLAMNLRWGLPFDDGSVDCIYLSHVLEHLYFPNDVGAFLSEAKRCLAPGGWIRIVVPDIAQCIDAYVREDRGFFDARRENWPGWQDNATPLADFLSYAGAGTDPGYLFESHKYGYDAETLQRTLETAGFADVRHSEYMQSTCADLNLDARSATASASHPGGYYSLFMDARRPG